MKAKTTGSFIALTLAAAGAFVLVTSRAAAVEAVYPVARAKRALTVRVWSRITGLFRASAANAENVRLRREVASLAMLRGEVERLDAENARLRRALGYVAKEPGTWLAAGVLSRGGGAAGTAGGFLRVDKGSLDGVREGAVVAVPEGLVGRVTEVTPHTAGVTLVTEASVKVACAVETGTGAVASGILVGGGEDRLVLKHLKGAEGVPPRARVLTSGLGGVFPPGLEVGTLLDVRKDANGLACVGEVLPPVVYSTLEDVFIRHEG